MFEDKSVKKISSLRGPSVVHSGVSVAGQCLSRNLHRTWRRIQARTRNLDLRPRTLGVLLHLQERSAMKFIKWLFGWIWEQVQQDMERNKNK